MSYDREKRRLRRKRKLEAKEAYQRTYQELRPKMIKEGKKRFINLLIKENIILREELDNE